jgi:signal transduction histidine kinase
MASYEFLRKIPLFSSLPDDDLQSLCQIVQEFHLPSGQVLFEEGSTGDMAYIIRGGEVEIVKISQKREILLATRGPGEVFGEIALIFDSPRTATVRARTDTDLVGIGREDLRKLLQISPSAAASMFDIVLSRLQNTQNLLKQSEKMAQLGTFTAGIAHELNNPSAAVQRSAQQLDKALFDSAHTFMRLVREELTSLQQEALERFVKLAQQRAREMPDIDPLQRSDREVELEEWLEVKGVEDAWESAITLVNLDFSDEDLEALAAVFSGDQLPVIIGWLNNNYTIFNLLNELKQGAQRISAIVKALKSYTYLDQAPIVRYNVHQGLDDTLLILRHKLKSGLTIKREYDASLPEIDAHGSELNQVWTNLIDNAADAIQNSGTKDGVINISTRQEGKWIIVTIEDNGPGISSDVLPRIFEAFYTTKPIGQGTGLGLDISYNIVVRRHQGDIRVRSEPGQTQFEVWLPTELQEES